MSCRYWKEFKKMFEFHSRKPSTCIKKYYSWMSVLILIWQYTLTIYLICHRVLTYVTCQTKWFENNWNFIKVRRFTSNAYKSAEVTINRRFYKNRHGVRQGKKSFKNLFSLIHPENANGKFLFRIEKEQSGRSLREKKNLKLKELLMKIIESETFYKIYDLYKNSTNNMLDNKRSH